MAYSMTIRGAEFCPVGACFDHIAGSPMGKEVVIPVILVMETSLPPFRRVAGRWINETVGRRQRRRGCSTPRANSTRSRNVAPVWTGP